MSEELSDLEEMRALLAVSCLGALVDAAKKQRDIVTWRRVGGLELEDFAMPSTMAADTRFCSCGKRASPRPTARSQVYASSTCADLLFGSTLHSSGSGLEKAKRGRK